LFINSYGQTQPPSEKQNAIKLYPVSFKEPILLKKNDMDWVKTGSCVAGGPIGGMIVYERTRNDKGKKTVDQSLPLPPILPPLRLSFMFNTMMKKTFDK